MAKSKRGRTWRRSNPNGEISLSVEPPKMRDQISKEPTLVKFPIDFSKWKLVYYENVTR